MIIHMIIEALKYIAFFCWLSFSVSAILGVLAQTYRPKRGERKAENVELVIVSKANHKVEKALFECISYHKKKFSQYRLRIVVDEGSELIPKLREHQQELVIVPNTYRRDLIGKGRAINYFIETEAEPGKWYAFIDDDNLVLDDDFLYEIPYYEKKGYVAMNPILLPRKGKSTVAYIMDFIRYFEDITIFRFFTGLLKKPLIGFHGELLTVRGDVLKEIGFSHRSLVEDFRFSSEISRRGYKVWQSRTKVSIKSPNSVIDLMRQRGRWFKGLIRDWRYCPNPMKIIVALRLIIWMVGVIGSWALSPLWFLFWGPFYPAIPGGLYYWLIYIYGILKANKPHYFFLIPIFGIIEVSSIYAGIRQKEYVVIDKN